MSSRERRREAHQQIQLGHEQDLMKTRVWMWRQVDTFLCVKNATEWSAWTMEASQQNRTEVSELYYHAVNWYRTWQHRYLQIEFMLPCARKSHQRKPGEMRRASEFGSGDMWECEKTDPFSGNEKRVLSVFRKEKRRPFRIPESFFWPGSVFRKAFWETDPFSDPFWKNRIRKRIRFFSRFRCFVWSPNYTFRCIWGTISIIN